MAPTNPDSEESIEAERLKFMEELQEFHDKRGTTLDPAPKVGSVNLNLHDLYQRITNEGGYDKVSDTRTNKLAWRRIAMEFMPHNANIVTLAFQVKTAYYKNLAAYEIKHFHNRDPPPKDILEDLTAKGGDLLNRTLDNYSRRARKELEDLNGDGTGSEDEDKMDIDDTPGARVTRAGLRQAPPQRVLFGQAEPTFRPRTTISSPTPGHSIQSNGYGSSQTVSTLANYEPRPLSALNVKAVASPANNPQWFKELNTRQKASLRRNKGLSLVKGMMLPGTGYPGPNIYMRCLFALQSGIASEVRYALHHLVKISHERGDKFRFDQFVNLADNLLQIMCSVSELWYNHPGWEFSWEDMDHNDFVTLNQLTGTANILEKIRHYERIRTDGLHSSEWLSAMSDVTSATLVVRNMIILDDNAHYICTMPLIKDTITIILQLPCTQETVEVKYYALEIAEQLTRFWTLAANDGLYLSLLSVILENISDRGIIITGLRSLSRISMDLEATNSLEDLPSSLLIRIYQWLLVQDEDLRGACLDLLYQYTAVMENVQSMVNTIDTEALVDMLMQFLMLGSLKVPQQPKVEPKPTMSKITTAPAATATAATATAAISSAIAENLPKLAPSIVQKLCQITDPKEQSSAWLRTCFIEDAEGEITQLALWSAYNEAFNSLPGDAQLMVAKDFITNVTNVFPKAQARVVPHDQDGGRVKYTMKGISPRAIPMDFRNRPYIRCMWRIPVKASTETTPPLNGESLHKDCDVWFSPSNVEELWSHMVETHIEVPRDSDDPKKFNDKSLKGSGRKFACHWSGCNKFPEPGVEDAHKVCMHVKSHLPDHGPGAAVRAKYTKDPNVPIIKPSLDLYNMNTAVDESGHPIGLPLAGILVLRNLARQMLKIDEQAGGVSLIERHFALHLDRIFEVMAYNTSLRAYAPEFIDYVSKGMDRAYSSSR